MNEKEPGDSVESIAPEAKKLVDTCNPAPANSVESLEPGATGRAEPSEPTPEKVESGGATSEDIHADDADAEARMRRMSRRSFIWGGAAIGGVLLGRGVINSAAEESGIPWPLRLVIPVKYGIKNIKRIGTIRWTNPRPPDYWTERGYDWYAGH